MNKREAEIRSNQLIAILTKERLKQKVSRGQIAKNLRMSTTTISKIEENKQNPKLLTLYMIADFLGFDIQFIPKK